MGLTSDGFCQIYEDSRELPIGELKQSEAERVVGKLWEKYGHRFHRSEAKSKRSHLGDNSRLDSLLHANPIHARKPDEDKTLCGGVIRTLTAFAELGSERITCEFCKMEVTPR